MSTETPRLLAELATLERDRDEKAQAAFRRLIVGLADGAEPSAEEAAEVLQAANKTTADLTRELEKVRRRRRAKDAIAAAEKVVEPLAKLKRRREAAEQKLVDAHAEHRQAIAEIDAEEKRLQLIASQGGEARSQLIESAPDVAPELFDAWREACQEAGAAHERMLRAKDLVREIDDDARRLESKTKEQIRQLERTRPAGWEAESERLGKILADPAGHLRERRAPKLAEAEAAAAAAAGRRAELEAKLLQV